MGIPLPLDTIRHKSERELIGAVQALIIERRIDEMLVGLPLLLSGAEGAQSAYVRACAAMLEQSGVRVRFVDERYSTPRRSHMHSKHAPHPGAYDGDAAAACSLFDRGAE